MIDFKLRIRALGAEGAGKTMGLERIRKAFPEFDVEVEGEADSRRDKRQGPVLPDIAGLPVMQHSEVLVIRVRDIDWREQKANASQPDGFSVSPGDLAAMLQSA